MTPVQMLRTCGVILLTAFHRECPFSAKKSAEGLSKEAALTRLLAGQTAQDMKKSKLYGKLGKLIIQAAKHGGPDPASNTRLKDVLSQAKLVDCPKEIIERNLKKASDKQQADYTEVRATLLDS